MHILDGRDNYQIKLHPNEKHFHAAQHFIKAIKGRQWNDFTKTWIIPREKFASALELEQKLLAEISNRQLVQQLSSKPVQELPELDIDVDALLKKPLYPFQKPGVAYNLLHRQVLIGDQQGLGKTLQALATVVIKNEWPGLIICKNSLRMNWQEEIDKWTNMGSRTAIFSDSIKHTWPHLFQNGFFDIGIVNYEGLKKYFVKSIKIPPGEKLRLHHIAFYKWIDLFKWVIVDESHYVKDMDTIRTKITAGLTKGKPQVYLLSGTPLLNKPIEVYTQVCILNKQQYFGDLTTFKNNFCGEKNKKNLPALNRLLSEHCYYRRIKSQVAPDLPPKTRQIILCDIDNRDEYNRCESDFKKWLDHNLSLSSGQIDAKMRAEALVQMMELKKLAAYGKLEAVKEWIESMVEQGEKFVLFAFHKDIQEKLRTAAPGIVHLGGGRKADEVAAIKKKFWEDPQTYGCICSISADSEGHNLQVASYGGHVELPWHFGKCEQGEDRIHRIGTKDAVTWTYFLADKTIDRKIYKLIMEKKDMHDLVTGTDEQIETRMVDKMISLFNTL